MKPGSSVSVYRWAPADRPTTRWSGPSIVRWWRRPSGQPGWAGRRSHWQRPHAPDQWSLSREQTPWIDHEASGKRKETVVLTPTCYKIELPELLFKISKLNLMSIESTSCFYVPDLQLISIKDNNIDGFPQDCVNSIAKAMELPQPWIHRYRKTNSSFLLLVKSRQTLNS